jgi:hypothetical protein
LNRLAKKTKSDPERIVIFRILTESVNSAKLALTKIASPRYSAKKSPPSYSAEKSQESESNTNHHVMIYSRNPRASIYHPATVHDLPYEVLRLALIYLLPRRYDLLSPSLVCRSWNPVAQHLLDYRINIGRVAAICGLLRRSIVFGLENFPINVLSIEVDSSNEDCFYPLAILVAPTLSRLFLDFSRSELPPYLRHSILDIFILDTFLKVCKSIKRLELKDLVLKDDLISILPGIKHGLECLTNLTLIDCEGVGTFVENAPISNLRAFTYLIQKTRGSVGNEAESVETVINAVALNCPNITTLSLGGGASIASTSILKISSCCRRLERLTLCQSDLDLEVSDVDAITSLSHLVSLDIGQCTCRKSSFCHVSLRYSTKVSPHWRLMV